MAEWRIKTYVAGVVNPLKERIANLEKEVAALKKKPKAKAKVKAK